MAVYDKNSGATGPDPEKDILREDPSARRRELTPGEAEQAKARREEARKKLESKIAADEAAAKRRRSRIITASVTTVAVIAAATGGYFWWSHEQEKQREAEAAEAARWAQCAYKEEPSSVDFAAQAKQYADQFNQQREQFQQQIDTAQDDAQKSQMQKQLTDIEHWLSYLSDSAKERQNAFTSASRTATPPQDEKQSREGQVETDLTINRTTLTVELDRSAAACNTAAFLGMIDQKYFDKTPCHRLTKLDDSGNGIAVLQCGDPTGTGQGGPGFASPTEAPEGFAPAGDPSTAQPGQPVPVIYPKGTLAVANAGPDTGGSQFFLVYEDSQLPPDYSVIGHVSEDSMKDLADIASSDIKQDPASQPALTEGPLQDGRPAKPITVGSWSVKS